MNIEGLGASLVDQLIEQDLVHDFADLYKLEASQLEALVVAPRDPKSERAVPRKLGKVGRNVVDQIERSKENDLSRLVYALGIRHVGEKPRPRSRGISERWTGCSRRRSTPCRPRRKSARSWLLPSGSLPTSRATARSWRGSRPLAWHMAGQAPEPPRNEPDGSLAGKVFVLTGTLATLSREDATAAARASGAHVTKSVSKKTHYRRRPRRRKQAGEGAAARRRNAG